MCYLPLIVLAAIIYTLLWQFLRRRQRFFLLHYIPTLGA